MKAAPARSRQQVPRRPQVDPAASDQGRQLLLDARHVEEGRLRARFELDQEIRVEPKRDKR